MLFGLHRMKGKIKFYWSGVFYWTKKGTVTLSSFPFQTKNWQHIFLRIWLLGRSQQSKASQMSANDSSPPSLQKFSPPTCHAAAPQTPTLSSSPQSGLSSRLSNGSFSTQSLTNSRGSMHGVSFLLQIGLTRETVTIEAQDLSLSAVKDLVCSIVYQKVWYNTTTSCWWQQLFCNRLLGITTRDWNMPRNLVQWQRSMLNVCSYVQRNFVDSQDRSL